MIEQGTKGRWLVELISWPLFGAMIGFMWGRSMCMIALDARIIFDGLAFSSWEEYRRFVLFRFICGSICAVIGGVLALTMYWRESRG